MNEPYAQPEVAIPRTPLLERIVGVAVVMLVLVGVVAVLAGKRDDGPSPVALLSSAPDAVREAGSARMSLAMSMKSAGISMEMSGSGVVDFVTGAGSFDFTGFGQTFQLLTDGTTLWMKLPDVAAAQLPGAAGKWVAVPITAAGGAQAGMFGPDQATSYLDALRGAGGDIVDLGEEAVNGVNAHHYAVSIDIDDALAAMPEERRAQAEAGFAQLGTDRMPVDVWLSSDGLPVRTTFVLGSNGAMPMQMHMQMDLTDFGVPVEITAPPADQVVDIGDPTQLGSMFSEVA